MGCPTFYKSGLGGCSSLFKKLVGFLLLDKGTTVPAATAGTLAIWKAIIAGSSNQLGFYIPITNGYQNNTGEPERNTSNVGFTRKTHDPAPMLGGFADASFCDYKSLWDADNKDFDFVGVDEDGNFWVFKNSDGAYGGFSSTFSIRKNAPSADNIAESYPVYVDFKYTSELDNGVIIDTEFAIKELVNAIPVGLTGSVATAWATDTVTVKVLKRCQTSPYAGLTATTNWEVLSAKADLAVSVSVVDAANAALGVYVLTIAGLTDDVVIRGVNDDGTSLTYVTQPITISV